jgi:hypothetical protein
LNWLSWSGEQWPKHRPTPPIDGDEVVRAIQRFSEAHRPLPAKVKFSQLISEGYLDTNVLRKFGASEVTVYLDADQTPPQSFLMDALMPDGTHTTLLSDGSVQGFTKSRLQQAAAPDGGPATPPRGSDASGRRRQVSRSFFTLLPVVIEISRAQP